MPQDDLGATLDELQSLVAGVGVGDAAFPKTVCRRFESCRGHHQLPH
jgi:hypothetical protein